MDRVRYVLGVFAVVVYAPGLVFWFVIHPWARWWRTIGPTRTYLIVGPLLAALGVLLLPFRRSLLGSDLGTNWSLVAAGLVLCGFVAWLGLVYGRRMNHLKMTTRMGVPELSPSNEPNTLVRDGIYGLVRHPVYISAAAWGIGYAFIVNYASVYILFLAALPVLYVITVLEERELLDRFGDEYREYQRTVPRLIPRWRKMD